MADLNYVARHILWWLLSGAVRKSDGEFCHIRSCAADVYGCIALIPYTMVDSYNTVCIAVYSQAQL